MSQVIQLGSTLSRVQNDQIQVYSTSTIIQLSDSLDQAITSTSIVVEPQLNFVLFSNETINSQLFGDVQFNRFVPIESIESTNTFDNTQLNLSLITNSVTNLNEFGSSKLNFAVSPVSVTTTNNFGTDYTFNFTLYSNPVLSTLQFGDFTQLNMEIENVPFPSIESTIVIPSPAIVRYIKPLGIATTASFGVASFIDNIHRILVFKNDNISKIGENDAAVIAGGIRLNPASTASNTASSGSAELPEAPVGFLSVNIGGVDYKIPYYNS